MKTVKITIEVKVPNKTKFVAVDKNGYGILLVILKN